MQTFSFEEFKSMNLSPYQIYGLDLDYQQYYSIQNYLKNKNDTIDKDQILNVLFLDIEVYTSNSGTFPKIDIAKFPISSITIYSTFNKTFKSFFLLQHANIHKFPIKEEIPNLIHDFTTDLIQHKYITENEKLEINIFTTEIDLIRSCWNSIKEIDPTIISGWNCDEFDIPYIYFRLSNLLNKNETEINKILSQFGKVKIDKYANKFLIKIPEYPVLDLLYAYKPRDDGGLNMGSKQSSYSLDYVSNTELNLQKKEYKSAGMSLDTFYETDPVNFLLYNIIDVALCVRMDEKLKHIESYNLLRRLMKTSFTASLRGPSILFDTYVNYKLNEEGKYTRFGILEEISLSISEDDISTLYIPKMMKKTIKEVSQNMYKSIIGHYPGAYVKNSNAQILTSKDGIIVDLDASSLYPNMINQLNISFDTFFGKIIDPLTYNFMSVIEKPLMAKIGIPQNVYINLYEMIVKYVDILKAQNKGDYIQNCYIVMAYLLNQISSHKKSLNQILDPQNIEDYIILKRYFLPLIDLFDDIHPRSKEYNSFCHDYLINNELPQIQHLYIIENILKPTIKIIKIPTKSFENYLKENNLIISLSGCLFVKHEIKKGLFTDFLKNLKEFRNNYEKERDKFQKGTYDYNFFEMRQKAIKITMNTTYGLFGQANYRFSNKHLAKSITVQGRLTLKVAQIIAEMYLESLKTERVDV